MAGISPIGARGTLAATVPGESDMRGAFHVGAPPAGRTDGKGAAPCPYGFFMAIAALDSGLSPLSLGRQTNLVLPGRMC